MKTAGIIGGLGPETTAKFYLEIVFSCYKKNRKKRPPLLMWNVPLPHKIEENLITKSKGAERYIPFLINAAVRLEKNGADFLVMPCNSLHIFIKKIRKAVKIPVLDICEETAQLLKENKIKKVGILATTTTLRGKLYEDRFNEIGIKQIIPDNIQQIKIGKIINNLVLNQHSNNDRKELLEIIGSLKNKGAKTIILACTDLQILVPKFPGIKIFDTMKILANSTV